MSMNDVPESESDLFEIGTKLLGLKELQPETVSHSGKGMTDLGDKSQVISRSAEAELTKKDLPRGDHRDHDDSGAPLDFSSSLSSIAGLLSPTVEDKGRVDSELPRGSPGENPTDDSKDPDSLEKQYEFAKFNQKFIPLKEETAASVPESLPRLVPGEDGIAEDRVAPASTIPSSQESKARSSSQPHLRLAPGEGECGEGKANPGPEPSPRGLRRPLPILA